jgi:dTDP-glucose 4,6-dehydratase
MGEETSKELCSAVKSHVNIVRLFHTFGPGVRRNDGRSFADFLYSAADGKIPKLHSDGTALRTFLFSADAVNAILAILTRGINLETYNVGSDMPISILDFAKRVSSIAGLKDEVLFDSTLPKGHIQSPNKALIPDLKKISNLGWRIQTSLDDSIEKTLCFLREESFH